MATVTEKSESIEKTVRGALNQLDVSFEFSRVMNEFRQAVVADVESEVIGSDVLQFVSLIEDHRAVVGQDRGDVRFPNGKVSEKQVVIDDDDVCLHRLLPDQSQEASFIVLALRAGAPVAPRIHTRPEFRVVPDGTKFGPVACLGILSPVEDRLKCAKFTRGEQSFGV